MPELELAKIQFADSQTRGEQNQSAELKMPKFIIARMIVILLSAVVLYFGIAGLKSGKIRSRGYTFNRDENPLGFWITVFVSLVGPVIIIYLMLTR